MAPAQVNGTGGFGSTDVTVLFVEPDSPLRWVIGASLEQQGWRVLLAKTTEFASDLLERETPNVLVLDLEVDSYSGQGIVEKFRDIEDECPKPNGVLIVTTRDRFDRQARREYDPDAVIYKPYDARYLNRLINTFIEESMGNGSESQG